MREQKSILLFFLVILITPYVLTEQIKLSLDLEINEPENIIFHGLFDIATDSKNNIYLLDYKEKMIYLFSEEGRFQKKIGRPGQGPGEFERPRSIYLDSKDTVYILDEWHRRVEIFDSKANYIKSIKFLNFPTGEPSIIVDKSGNFYISGYYRIQNAVVAKFASTGELIKYFPLPVKEYKGIKLNGFEKIEVMEYLCGGSMCFDEEEKKLFFSYKWPYSIKILTKTGKELFQFSRKNNLNWTPLILKTDRNGFLFGPYTSSLKIFLLNNNYLVNSISCVDWEGNPKIKLPPPHVLTKNPEKYFKIKGQFAVLDIYTKEGDFIASTVMDGKIYFLCSDNKGRLLAIKVDENDIPTIVRYRIEMTNN